MNNKTAYSILPRRAVLRISGADSCDFLQGIITNNIRKLTAENSIYAALLSPQGKLLHDFFISRWQRDGEDCLLLDCEAERKQELISRLNMYKLRARVTIADISDEMAVAVVYGENTAAALGFAVNTGGATRQEQWGVCYRDPRIAAAGFRLMVTGDYARKFTQSRDIATSSPVEYDRLRLHLALPDGSRDFIPDRSLALEMGIDRLGGVDFNKGCYVGQEVTARSKHRGNMRKALFKVTTCGSGQDLPVADATVKLLHAGAKEEAKEIGVMRSAYGDIGLAILNCEAVAATEAEAEAEAKAEAKPQLLAGADVKITATRPQWWNNVQSA